MAKKIEENNETTEGMRNFINTWTSESNKFLRMWGESNVKLYQPLIDFVGDESIRLTDMSVNATPEKYQEFYDNWMKTYRNSFGKVYPVPVSSPKEALEDLNEKVSDDILDNPAIKYQKEILQELYTKLYIPSQDSIVKISTMKPSKEMMDSLKESMQISLNLFKSWIVALEKISEKMHEQSKLMNDPEAFKEFYGLWIKMYEKSLEDIFEGIPLASPLKEMMEPVKSACKIYANTSIKMSRMWMDSFTRISSPQK
jgi:hypothetical protein